MIKELTTISNFSIDAHTPPTNHRYTSPTSAAALKCQINICRKCFYHYTIVSQKLFPRIDVLLDFNHRLDISQPARFSGICTARKCQSIDSLNGLSSRSTATRNRRKRVYGSLSDVWVPRDLGGEEKIYFSLNLDKCFFRC